MKQKRLRSIKETDIKQLIQYKNKALQSQYVLFYQL